MVGGLRGDIVPGVFHFLEEFVDSFNGGFAELLGGDVFLGDFGDLPELLKENTMRKNEIDRLTENLFKKCYISKVGQFD